MPTWAAQEKYTVWNPVHFAAEYAELVRVLDRIPAQRVVLVTVPHVTIAPIAQGVNPTNPQHKWREGSRYFPYYTDPGIAEQNLSPTRPMPHAPAGAGDRLRDRSVQRRHRRPTSGGNGPPGGTGS